MTPAVFENQIAWLGERFEFATLESTLAFLAGDYGPSRDLCLLTFDDGVRDHLEIVFPVLASRRIQGLFFVVSSCLQGRVASVHKSHFLMASLGFDEYRHRCLERLREAVPADDLQVNPAISRSTYRWDTDEVAQFKYLLNFALPDIIRRVVLDDLFSEHLGDEVEFSRRLYLSWADAVTLQRHGMVIGGHTHTHAALSRLAHADQERELERSTALLRERLDHQALWPFSYPYGKADSFDDGTIELLRELGYACAFTTEPGRNSAGRDGFRIRRIDPKEIGAYDGTAVGGTRVLSS